MTGFSTNAVHAGEQKDLATGAVVTPIYETTIFAFSDTQNLIDVVSEKREGYIYSRYGNPTVRALEKKVAKLEAGCDSTVFSSGMAALMTTFCTLMSHGDHIVSARDIYGGTFGLLTKILPRLGIDTSLVETTDIQEMTVALKENTKVIFVEIPTNPVLKIPDLLGIINLAKKANVKVIVDSTFATPYNLRPLDWGVDVVIHSATKYLGGHDDVIAGVACSSDEDIQVQLKEMRRYFGGNLDPIPAWLVLRGLKTLGLRMQKHNANGMDVSRFLENHPQVKRVYYPGLQSHPQYLLAKKQMSGFGGVVSFEVDGSFEKTKKFVEGLELCTFAISLGGTETLVSQPVTSSHYFVNEHERKKTGITNQLVRLSLGIEDSSDIIDDLKQAFKKI